jgi:murein tripeptide amidase MpaA
MRRATLLLGLTISFISLENHMAQTIESGVRSRAEETNFEETSRYDDVMKFVTSLQQRSNLIRVTSFGRTEEGRTIPLLILSNPPVSQPSEAQRSGRPVVFIMANIHAGEVEGKEAVQHISRRLAAG